MSRKIVILLLVGLLVGGLSVSAFAAGHHYGGVWKDALMSNPPDLDPAQATDTTSSEMIYQMFEALVEYNNAGEVSPLLAKSWEI